MLAIVRLPSWWMGQIENNPSFKPHLKFFIGQEHRNRYMDACSGPKWVVRYHPAAQHDQPRMRREILEAFKQYQIRYALVTQKLLWYSDLTESVCQELKIPLTWCEVFFDDRIIMDRTGLQYCRENELKFETQVKASAPILPQKTRQPQPNLLAPRELYQKLGVVSADDCVVVLGQVPWDMALVQRPGLSYPDWLKALFTQNPKTTFLFKHHPQAKTTGLEGFTNVKIINEGLETLWNGFQNFASFSSTTIFEGMIKGRKFITGGYHFCSGLTPTVHTVEEAKDVVGRLKAYQTPREAWERRLSFICNHYTIPLESPRLWDRIVTPTKEYFASASPIEKP